MRTGATALASLRSPRGARGGFVAAGVDHRRLFRRRPPRDDHGGRARRRRAPRGARRFGQARRDRAGRPRSRRRPPGGRDDVGVDRKRRSAARGRGLARRRPSAAASGACATARSNRLPVYGEKDALPDCDAGGVDEPLGRSDSTSRRATCASERTRSLQGTLHETRVYTFRGFEMRLDAREVVGRDQRHLDSGVGRGDALPERRTSKSSSRRYALSRAARRARGCASRRTANRAPSRRCFRIAQGELRLPVTASKPFEQDEKGLEISAGDEGKVAIRLIVAGGKAPQSAAVRGAGRLRRRLRLDHPVAGPRDPGLRQRRAGARAGVPARRLDDRPPRAHRRLARPGAGVRPSGGRRGRPGPRGRSGGHGPAPDAFGRRPGGWALKLEGPDAFRRVPVQCGPDGARLPRGRRRTRHFAGSAASSTAELVDSLPVKSIPSRYKLHGTVRSRDARPGGRRRPSGAHLLLSVPRQREPRPQGGGMGLAVPLPRPRRPDPLGPLRRSRSSDSPISTSSSSTSPRSSSRRTASTTTSRSRGRSSGPRSAPCRSRSASSRSSGRARSSTPSTWGSARSPGS